MQKPGSLVALNDDRGDSESKSVTRIPPTVVKIVVITGLIFFICSSLRHGLFQSTGFDLGIYDQVVYLISQGQPPISSILGFHHLGNHAAWAVYPLALFYKIYPDVHWLLLIQAVALTLGVLPIWSLARQAGLSEKSATLMGVVYLLYPVIFNINLFDFHPEVMALPAFFGAILAAKLQKIGWFSLAVFWVLGCKAVLSLTVIAFGVWLLLFEKRRLCGLIALGAGIAWFLIATQKLIPALSGSEAAGVWRYTYLGNSVLEIALNLLLRPQLILGKIISLETIKYLVLLCLPVLWGLSPRYLLPLLPALPTLTVNSLSDVSFQRSLAYHYSLPVIPFLFLAAISAVAAENKGRGQFPFLNFQFPKRIILWSVLLFLLLGEGKDFALYFNRLDTWQATREALSQVSSQGSILTDNRLAPHLTHRSNLKLLSQVSPETNLAEFNQVILNLRHPWPDTKETGIQLANQLRNSSNFKLSYERDQVLVFTRF